MEFRQGPGGEALERHRKAMEHRDKIIKARTPKDVTGGPPPLTEQHIDDPDAPTLGNQVNALKGLIFKLELDWNTLGNNGPWTPPHLDFQE